MIDADQRLQLIASLAEIGLGARFIRLELRQLQVETLVVELADVAGIEARLVDIEFMPEILQVVLSQS